jgi:hypothetical protein
VTGSPTVNMKIISILVASISIKMGKTYDFVTISKKDGIKML